MITAECNGSYWNNSTESKTSTCFVNEFVVDQEHRGKRIGSTLTKMTVDPILGIWALMPEVKEMYTTIHEDNIGSRKAFLNGDYTEVITYADAYRNRNTTVLKYSRPEGVLKTTVAANISDQSLYVEEKKVNSDGEPVDSNGKRMYKKAEYG
jgi:hypothetical protein